MEIKGKGMLILKAYDVDTMSDDLIGTTKGINWKDFTYKPEIVVDKKLKFLDKGGKEVGTVEIST